MNYAQSWRETAHRQRMFADLALCDEARRDHLMWAEAFDRLADTWDDRIDYAAITRDVANMFNA